MTDAKHFSVSGQELSDKPYHYRACGLDNVYLKNGYTVEETDYGRGVMVHDIPGLHRAIGLHLVSEKKLLGAREFRFLRKEMSFTQEKLAKLLLVDVQTVARYEKEQTAIPGPVDGMMRFLFAFHLVPEDERLAVLEDLNDELEARGTADDEGMCFSLSGGAWGVGC